MKRGVVVLSMIVSGCMHAAYSTKFSTPDGTVGYNISCAYHSEIMESACYKRVYEKADELCGAKHYDIISPTSRGPDYRIHLLISCKK